MTRTNDISTKDRLMVHESPRITGTRRLTGWEARRGTRIEQQLYMIAFATANVLSGAGHHVLLEIQLVSRRKDHLLMHVCDRISHIRSTNTGSCPSCGLACWTSLPHVMTKESPASENGRCRFLDRFQSPVHLMALSLYVGLLHDNVHHYAC